MNRERALEIAREVMAGKARSYVSAAHALAAYLLELDGALIADAPPSGRPFVMGQGVGTPHAAPFIETHSVPAAPDTEPREVVRPRALRVPSEPEIPCDPVPAPAIEVPAPKSSEPRTGVLGSTVGAKEIFTTRAKKGLAHGGDGDCG